jgi:hypothetical protein
VDEIFVSWAMPDKSVVDRIIGRLDDLGMLSTSIHEG